jgi:hypothetical protein
VRNSTLDVALLPPRGQAVVPECVKGSAFLAEVVYGNTGDVEAPGTRLMVTLPDGVTWFGAKDEAGAPVLPDTSEGNTLVWDLGTLPPATCCRRLVLSEAAGPALTLGQVITHVAVIRATGVESITANNKSSSMSVLTELVGSYKRVHVSTAMPGDVLTYTIVVSAGPHMGMMGGRTFSLTDVLPISGQVRFLGWTQPVSGAQSDGRVLRWQGIVRAGQPVTIQYRLWTRGGPGEPWAMLGEPARVMSGTLVFATTQFTEFALFDHGAFRIFVPVIMQ